MDEISSLLQAIQTVRPELPALVGTEWPQFEAQLNTYLHQLELDPARAQIIEAQIMFLFSRYEPARKRLAEARAVYSDETETNRGLADREAESMSPSAAAAPVPASDRLVSRYTDISSPRQVWVKTGRFSVVVRLTVKQREESAAASELPGLHEQLPVDVHIEAPQCQILGAPKKQIIIVPDADSEPVVFDLRPLQVGHAGITLDFFQSGNPVGTATFTVEVVEQEVVAHEESRQARPISVDQGLASPDLVLRIAWNKDASALQFSLVQDNGASWNDGFRPVLIHGDPSAHAAALYRQIASLVGKFDPTVDAVLEKQMQIPSATVERRLKQLGQNLWKDLIPEELKALYGRERENWRDRTLLVISDEPYFPWELVWPYEGGAWEDEGPWCQTLRLTRWLRKDYEGNGNDKVSSRLTVGKVAVLAPTYSLLPKLASAQSERQALLEMIKEHSVEDVSPAEPTLQSVMDMLEAGGYDLDSYRVPWQLLCPITRHRFGDLVAGG